MNNRKFFLGDKPNVETFKTMDFLKDVNPKFAEHMYFKNRIVEAFAMSEYGGVHALEQPMCKKCEQPGWHTGNNDTDAESVNCYCPKCGSTSWNTLSLRDYLIQELNFGDEVIRQMEQKIYEKVV